jgi:AAA family ATP:ADP antiporter
VTHGSGSGAAGNILRRLVDVRPGETASLLWSAAYFYFVLSAYYVIRPIRDEMGAAGGVDNLSWLFTGTLIAMILVHTPYAALVSKLPRKRFIPITYRFFATNLVIFFILLKVVPQDQLVWVGRVFFVWTSVFNLFVVSVFWAMLADVWHTDQGKRLFAFIAVGGTLGAVSGSAVTAFFANIVGQGNLLLVSAVLIEVSVWCARRLGSKPPAQVADGAAASELDIRPVGGGAFDGLKRAVQSPYLLGICIYMLLFTVGSTLLYFQQADIANATYTDRGERTAWFARIDLWTNIVTAFMQMFLTAHIVRALGVALTLTLLPALSVLGFGALGFAPTAATVMLFQILRRAGNYAVARPMREVLFTAMSRDDKYKAKNLVDTLVYRTGDQLGAWLRPFLTSLGLSITGISFVAVPLSALWLGIGYALGRHHERRAAVPASQSPAPVTSS